MNTSMLTADQVHEAMQEAQAGSSTADASRTRGRSEAGFPESGFPHQQRQLDGYSRPDVSELQSLQQEVRRLKRVVAELSADKRTLSEAVSRLW